MILLSKCGMIKPMMTKPKEFAPWFVYMVRCHDGSLYTGVAKSVMSRIAEHNSQTGAAYTRARAPVELVYQERCVNHSSALKRESLLKKLSRQDKIKLITSSNS